MLSNLREKTFEMATRIHRETHCIEQTQEVIPFSFRENSFGQNVSELVFGVNVFDLNFGVPVLCLFFFLFLFFSSCSFYHSYSSYHSCFFSCSFFLFFLVFFGCCLWCFSVFFVFAFFVVVLSFFFGVSEVVFWRTGVLFCLVVFCFFGVF